MLPRPSSPAPMPEYRRVQPPSLPPVRLCPLTIWNLPFSGRTLIACAGSKPPLSRIEAAMRSTISEQSAMRGLSGCGSSCSMGICCIGCSIFVVRPRASTGASRSIPSPGVFETVQNFAATRFFRSVKGQTGPRPEDLVAVHAQQKTEIHSSFCFAHQPKLFPADPHSVFERWLLVIAGALDAGSVYPYDLIHESGHNLFASASNSQSGSSGCIVIDQAECTRAKPRAERRDMCQSVAMHRIKRRIAGEVRQVFLQK